MLPTGSQATTHWMVKVALARSPAVLRQVTHALGVRPWRQSVKKHCRAVLTVAVDCS